MATLNATPGGIALLAQTAAQCETFQQIIDIAATAEALAVTAIGGAIQSALDGQLA